MNYYTNEELKEKLFYQKKENKIFMPNRIFDDLVQTINTNLPNRSCEHIAFAYSYVYLTSYLYRYAIYGITDLFTNQKDLLKFLRTPRDYKHKTYITKKNGILDQLNYIKKQKDFPIAYDYIDYYKPTFTMFSETKKHYPANLIKKYPANCHINFPHRAFFDEDNKANNGYFFNIENTHMVLLDTFIFCMSKKGLGTIGFYLYSFFKHKTDLFPAGYNISKEKLIKITGIKEYKLKCTLKELEAYNMITNSHEPFYANLHHAKQEISLKPCSYLANHPKHFTQYKKEVIVREVINLKEKEKEAN